MNTIKSILVGLDIRNYNPEFISYVGFLCKILEVKEVKFIYVCKDPDLPDKLKRDFLKDDASLRKTLLIKLKKTVLDNFGTMDNFDIDYDLIEGNPLSVLLSKAKTLDIDLIVLNRKKDGDSTLLTKIARMAYCSVLIVPTQIALILDNILVCSDFSVYSRLALKRALCFNNKKNPSTIHIQHIYSVPMGYHAIGKTFSNFAEAMRKNAVKRYNEFLKYCNVSEEAVVPIFTLNENSKPTRLVQETAASIQTKLVVICSRGRTLAAAIFLGSFAEKMVRREKNTPLLIVKKKNDIMGIIQALKEI